MILFGDRDELHREGAHRWVLAVLEALPYNERSYLKPRKGTKAEDVLEVMREGWSSAAASLERGEDLEAAAKWATRRLLPYLEAVQDATQQIERLRLNLDHAASQVELYRGLYNKLKESAEAAHLSELKAQIYTLRQKKDEFERQATSLSQTLNGQRQYYKVEIRRMQKRIADLNRIVAEQQKQLNDFLEDVV